MSDWPFFEADEIQAAIRVLRSQKVNQWTGEEVRLFEKEFAEYIGTKYAVAMMNGSVTLEAALEALEIGYGDDVIVTPRSFIASVSCVSRVGANPIFADVSNKTGNLTAESIEKAITPSTRAVILVHLGGLPCNIAPILELCKENGIHVIEDCAQAHGAKYDNKYVGSMGIMGSFSFCQDKIMTTGGEGGMITTNDETVHKRLLSLRDHGKDIQSLALNRDIGFKYACKSPGTNLRMTEMQAAIGRVQLKKVEEWVKRRRCIAALYYASFVNVNGLRAIVVANDNQYWPSYYRYYLYVDEQRLREGWNRDRILQDLIDKGVPCTVGVCPTIYKEEAFPFANHLRLPNAEMLGRISLCLPCHHQMTLGEASKIAKEIQATLYEAGNFYDYVIR